MSAHYVLGYDCPQKLDTYWGRLRYLVNYREISSIDDEIRARDIGGDR